jgi:error-prone DNA polymerase
LSAWLKCHFRGFGAALLNSQPMGFYAPAQIVRDMQEHGVEVRAPDVNHSGGLGADAGRQCGADGTAVRSA